MGHSREGSSDDGFGSSGRQTLSPSSISSNNVGAQNYNPHYATSQTMNVVHQRQASAPELNYGEEHAQQVHPISNPGPIHHQHHHHLPPHG